MGSTIFNSFTHVRSLFGRHGHRLEALQRWEPLAARACLRPCIGNCTRALCKLVALSALMSTSICPTVVPRIVLSPSFAPLHLTCRMRPDGVGGESPSPPG